MLMKMLWYFEDKRSNASQSSLEASINSRIHIDSRWYYDLFQFACLLVIISTFAFFTFDII